MSELLLDRIIFEEQKREVKTGRSANDEYFRLFEINEEKLKAELNEYSSAYRHAADIIVK